MSHSKPPLIFHVLHRLSIGGLENGVINLINHMPEDRYRHAIVAMTEITDFSERLTKKNIGLYALNKKAGKDLAVYWRFYQLIKQYRPAIVHTRNLGTIDMQIPAFLAGVAGRVHSEHGWDASDPCGQNKKNQWIRRIAKPFIHYHIGLSTELVDYQIQHIGVAENKIKRIYNGVDSTLFKASKPINTLPLKKSLIFATVGRMTGVKDQVTLTQAFIQLCLNNPQHIDKLGLVLVGEGDLKQSCEDLLKQANLMDHVWLAGARTDIADILKQVQVFVLPSTAEGISNTILEAMASSLPVIATEVGGNSELVKDKITGFMVPPSAPEKMAKAMQAYIDQPELIKTQGVGARQRIENNFSMALMVENYSQVYQQVFNASES